MAAAFAMPVHLPTTLSLGRRAEHRPYFGSANQSLPDYADDTEQPPSRVKPMLQMKRAPINPGRTMAAPARSRLQPLALPRTADHVIQRSEAAYISKGTKVREFDPDFASKHIRDAGNFTTEDAMIQAAVGKLSQRAKSGNTSTNTLVFMTSYQQQLFKEQQHNGHGKEYQSTTSFPVVEVSQTGVAKLYGAAQIVYWAKQQEDGTMLVYHMAGVASGSTPTRTIPLASKSINLSQSSSLEDDG
jgi:hypothetical protein